MNASGSTRPSLSLSLFRSATGYTTILSSSPNTALSKHCCTPVDPYLASMRSFMNSSAFFCCSFKSAFVVKLLPGKYSMKPFSSARFSAISASALVGTMFLCFSFSASKLSCAFERSILFAAIIIGFAILRSSLANVNTLCLSFKSNFTPSSSIFFNTRSTSAFFISRPVNCIDMICSMSDLPAFASCRSNFTSARSITLANHISISFSKNSISFSGSPSPGLPSASVCPVASTMCTSADACRRSSRNWLPIPFPKCASGTSPATSTIFTDTNRFPFLQNPCFGLHVTPNSLHTQSTII